MLVSNISEPVNIGNPQEITILQFAEAIQKAFGATSDVRFEPLPVDDPKTRQPDITRARTLLGWEPQVSLDEGLDKTIEWFKVYRSE